PGQVGPQLHQHLGGDPFALPDEAEQDVLGADVVVAELERLPQRELEHFLGPGREGDVARRAGPALADDLLHLGPDGLERDPERFERLGGDTLPLVDQPEEDVLRPDVVVVEQAGLLLGEDDDPPGSIGEALEHVPASCLDHRAPRGRGRLSASAGFSFPGPGRTLVDLLFYCRSASVPLACPAGARRAPECVGPIGGPRQAMRLRPGRWRSSWSTSGRSTTTTSSTRRRPAGAWRASTTGGRTSWPSWPATSSWPGRRRWPPRWGWRWPGSWPPPSVSSVRARCSSCSASTTSTATRPPTSGRSPGRRRR